jgi:type I restriction enzyme R subunit
MTNEAFSRVKIDAQLRDQGWDVVNPNAVRFEYMVQDGTKADYVLCDRNGRSLAVVEAKRSTTNPADAARQARTYAEQLDVPFIYLSNGEEVRFWDWRLEAHPRLIKTFFAPEDLERRFATRVVRKDPRATQDAGADGDRHRQDSHGGDALRFFEVDLPTCSCRMQGRDPRPRRRDRGRSLGARAAVPDSGLPSAGTLRSAARPRLDPASLFD